MLLNKFRNIPIVLGSQSPRRKELLQKMGLDFEVVICETDERLDPDLSPQENVVNIAINKNLACDRSVFKSALVITADTIVVCDMDILGKPLDEEDAFQMLSRLQGGRHLVYTAVSLSYKGIMRTFVEGTFVEFYPLSEEEIRFYIENYRPFDKAGSYGIQEWIGFIGIKAIDGSYENVVGLPTARLYQEMKRVLSFG